MKWKKINRHRVLSRAEIETLNFIWKWKMANTMTLKTVIVPLNSFWKFYKKLRRLLKEGYISETSDQLLQMSVWTLTKKGFNYLHGGSEALSQKRFKPQSVAHDYWALNFHLGDFVFGASENVQLISEQELSSSVPESLPNWVPYARDHIPDGYTFIEYDKKKTLMAFETEINAKSSARYEEMIRFLDAHDQIDYVFWLCMDDQIIERITQQIVSIPRQKKSKHNFIRFADFQKMGWDAPILWGSKAKSSISEVMGQYGVNIPVNKGAKPGQHRATEIFASSQKSPRGSMR